MTEEKLGAGGYPLATGVLNAFSYVTYLTLQKKNLHRKK